MLDDKTNRPKVAVAIATKGRPTIVSTAIKELKSQSYDVETIIVSCSTSDDIPCVPFEDNVKIIFGEAGLTRQRNRAIGAVPSGVDYLCFFDDDFIAHPTYISEVVAVFEKHREIVCITGNVLADGINGSAISLIEAKEILQRVVSDVDGLIIKNSSPYGCNMSFRVSHIKDIFFDERLVLYGWQEDRDFGAQVKRHGKTVKINRAYGVHLGYRGGRVPGKRLGYSQVVNPIYLVSKGSMTIIEALNHVIRNIAANTVRSIIFKDGEDRVGRLKGNYIAIGDFLRGKHRPEKVLEF